MGCVCPASEVKIYSTLPKLQNLSQSMTTPIDTQAVQKSKDSFTKSSLYLQIKCSDLIAADRYTLVDPVVHLVHEENGTSVVKDKTEIQTKTVNPDFKTRFLVEYCLEKPLVFKLEVFDTKDFKRSKEVLIGSNYFSLHDIVTSDNHSAIKPLLNPTYKTKNLGNIKVSCEEVLHSKIELELTCSITGNCKPDFYFQLFLKDDRDFYTDLYKSERSAQGNSSLTWGKFKIVLDHPGINKFFKIEINSSKKQEASLGCVKFSLQNLKENKFEYQITNTNLFNINTFLITGCSIKEFHSFLEFISGGCELSMMVGIDFTKPPESQNSLHFYSEDSLDDYTTIMKSFHSALSSYSNKYFPVFGFGAKLPPTHSTVSHSFALNNNTFDPEVKGMEGFISAYKEVLAKVQQDGPVRFSEVLRDCVEHALVSRFSQEKQRYFIVFLLTFGTLIDLDETIDQLVLASELPISIVIVGVGIKELSMMKYLDIKKQPVFSNTYQTALNRDIMQFINFEDFRNNLEEMVACVLKNIPGQVIDFMEFRKIVPRTRQNDAQVKRFINSRFSSPLSAGSNVAVGKAKNEFIDEVVKTGYNRNLVEHIVNNGIFCKNVQLVVEIIQSRKHEAKPPKGILRQSPNNLKTMFQKDENRKFCYICKANRVNVILKDCGCEIVCSKCVRLVKGDCPQCSSPLIKWTKKQIEDPFKRRVSF